MISFEHANAECTGSVMTVDMIPSKGKTNGIYSIRIAPQLTATYNVGRKRELATFDCKNSVSISLNVKQMAHVLLVLEGRATSIRGGKGVYDNCDEYVSLLHCDRVCKPVAGLQFHIITRYDGSSNATKEHRILLNSTEVLALSKAINASIGIVAFG